MILSSRFSVRALAGKKQRRGPRRLAFDFASDHYIPTWTTTGVCADGAAAREVSAMKADGKARFAAAFNGC